MKKRVKNSREEVKTIEKVSPVDDEPRLMLDKDEDESSRLNSTNACLPLSSLISIAITPFYTITALIYPMFIIPRPSTNKKGFSKPSSVVASKQRAEVRSIDNVRPGSRHESRFHPSLCRRFKRDT